MYILWNIIDRTIVSNDVPRRDALQHRVFLYMFVSLQFHPSLDATLNNIWLVVWNIFFSHNIWANNSMETITGWWSGTYFIFPNSWDDDPI